LRAAIIEGLAIHGIVAQPGHDPQALRDRLNDVYLAEVRRLRERQRAGEIPLAEYAAHVDALKRRYPLLGVPLSLWVE
jgi:hypothetical protein